MPVFNLLVVNTNLAELVFNDGYLLAMGACEDVVQQSGLSTAEEPSQHCYRNTPIVEDRPAGGHLGGQCPRMLF